MGTIYRALPVEMASMNGSASPNVKVKVGSDGTNPLVFKVLSFDAEENVYFIVRADGYVSGDLTFALDWYADTATSGNTQWSVAAAKYDPTSDTTDFEALAYGTEVTFDDAAGGTAQAMQRAIVTVTAPSGLGTEDLLLIRIRRNANAPADTMSGAAELTHATVSYVDS